MTPTSRTGRHVAIAVMCVTVWASACAGRIGPATQPDDPTRKAWARVMRLPPDTLVGVEDGSRFVQTGRLVSATQDQLEIDQRPGRRTFARLHVHRVFVTKESRRFPLPITVLGGTTGALIGAIAAPDHKVLAAVLLGAFGAIKGLFYDAIGNLIFEEGTTDEVVVYCNDAVLQAQPGG
jgi:hypothetical protein